MVHVHALKFSEGHKCLTVYDLYWACTCIFYVLAKLNVHECSGLLFLITQSPPQERMLKLQQVIAVMYAHILLAGIPL